MPGERTHASFFSGVGGLDLGLDRAGWRTVSVSEIDAYASGVLAERWPGIPNLGDIVRLAERRRSNLLDAGDGDGADALAESGASSAYLWTGGFPCQDLSVAGKRRGMVEGTRSNLAYAFLALVERHRPPAILLENVPGLLSSHGGRDMAALLGAMVELGYGVAYRVLDARYFGVPQRRRRVFIVGLRSGPDDPSGRAATERAAQVLSVGARCPRHPATGVEAGPDAAAGAPVGTLNARMGTGVHNGQDDHAGFLIPDTHPNLRAGGHGSPGIGRDGDEQRLIVGATPDAGRVRAPDGLAGRLDDRQLMGSLREHVRPGSNTDYTIVQEQAATLNSGGNDGGFRTEPGEHLVAFNPYRTLERDGSVTSGYAERPVVDALHGPTGNKEPLMLGSFDLADDPLLPLGLDSHRYRCCGNGVVAPVSEWLGIRLLREIETPPFPPFQDHPSTR